MAGWLYWLVRSEEVTLETVLSAMICASRFTGSVAFWPCNAHTTK